MDKFAITVGRQIGSGGKIMSDKLACRLKISCYDRELINIASKESGLGKEFFENSDEKSNFGIPGSYSGIYSGYISPGNLNYLCDETLFKIQSDVIKRISEQESCIFIGRCADYILRSHPRLLKIFISASLEHRISRLCTTMSINTKEAITLIEQTDKKRAAYYNYYSNKQWGVASTYDLCINTSTISIDQAVALIDSAVSSKFFTIS
ncbi:MAG: cytidylate kinase-like family protein [Dysgonamonadaceae bacterium]|jgi:cytidylate kinase|nr:cytidylate kinase-like family protein [Dysgonamonadaceae bacterium]